MLTKCIPALSSPGYSSFLGCAICARCPPVPDGILRMPPRAAACVLAAREVAAWGADPFAAIRAHFVFWRTECCAQIQTVVIGPASASAGPCGFPVDRDRRPLHLPGTNRLHHPDL